MRAEKKTFLEKCRLEGPASLKRMVWLRDHGETHAVRLQAAIAICDRGFGKPPQAVAIGIGDGQAIVTVITGCRERDPLLPPPRDLFANLPPSPRPCIDGETSDDS